MDDLEKAELAAAAKAAVEAKAAAEAAAAAAAKAAAEAAAKAEAEARAKEASEGGLKGIFGVEKGGKAKKKTGRWAMVRATVVKKPPPPRMVGVVVKAVKAARDEGTLNEFKAAYNVCVCVIHLCHSFIHSLIHL